MSPVKDTARTLRGATLWARSVHPEFAAICDACLGLTLAISEARAVALQGRTAAGGTVSICLDGETLLLNLWESRKQDGLSVIVTTEHRLGLPAYLRRHLPRPQPELVA